MCHSWFIRNFFSCIRGFATHTGKIPSLFLSRPGLAHSRTWKNYLPGKLYAYWTFAQFWTITESRHLSGLPGGAVILNATSCWKVRTEVILPNVKKFVWSAMLFISFIKKGVATLKGRLPKRTKSDFRGESQGVFINFPLRRPKSFNLDTKLR